MSHVERKLSADFLSRKMDISFPEVDFKRLLLRFWMAYSPPPPSTPLTSFFATSRFLGKPFYLRVMTDIESSALTLIGGVHICRALLDI
jgi:hypothetical protein